MEQVFISWSGEPSRAIARALKTWLPEVVQHVEPWVSVEDIKGGTRWNTQVAEALDQMDFGIVCLTASNQHQPWLMFEAGALAKRLHGKAGRVVPLYVDLGPADVTGPLAAFQGHQLDEEGMRELVQDLMELRENPLNPDRLFKAMWPELESQVNAAKQLSPEPQTARRTAEDMLEEVVEGVRRLERAQSSFVIERTQDIRVGLGRKATDTAKASDYVGGASDALDAVVRSAEEKLSRGKDRILDKRYEPSFGILNDAEE